MKAISVHPGRKKVQLIEHEEPRVTTATGVKLRMLDACLDEPLRLDERGFEVEVLHKILHRLDLARARLIDDFLEVFRERRDTLRLEQFQSMLYLDGFCYERQRLHCGEIPLASSELRLESTLEFEELRLVGVRALQAHTIVPQLH